MEYFDGFDPSRRFEPLAYSDRYAYYREVVSTEAACLAEWWDDALGLPPSFEMTDYIKNAVEAYKLSYSHCIAAVVDDYDELIAEPVTAGLQTQRAVWQAIQAMTHERTELLNGVLLCQPLYKRAAEAVVRLVTRERNTAESMKPISYDMALEGERWVQCIQEVKCEQEQRGYPSSPLTRFTMASGRLLSLQVGRETLVLGETIAARHPDHPLPKV